MKAHGHTLQALLRGPAVLSIPEAGRFMGLGRTASYSAARRGILPTIKVGERKVVVPTARLAALLGSAEVA